AQHLRDLVPASAHLRRAARLRGLLPSACDLEAAGPARRTGLAPAAHAAFGLRAPCSVVPRLARRHYTLPFHRQLTPHVDDRAQAIDRNPSLGQSATRLTRPAGCIPLGTVTVSKPLSASSLPERPGQQRNNLTRLVRFCRG